MIRWIIGKLSDLIRRLQIASSASRKIDGLWVGAFVLDEESDEQALLDRTEDALAILARYDATSYEKVKKHLRRIWVKPAPGLRGQYIPSMRTCLLAESFVADPGVSPTRIAATVVHEATHGRLQACGIAFSEGRRIRIERICHRAALNFASKAPNGESVVAEIEEDLASDLYSKEALWTDDERRARANRLHVLSLERLGAPKWLIRLIERGARDPAA